MTLLESHSLTAVESDQGNPSFCSAPWTPHCLYYALYPMNNVLFRFLIFSLSKWTCDVFRLKTISNQEMKTSEKWLQNSNPLGHFVVFVSSNPLSFNFVDSIPAHSSFYSLLQASSSLTPSEYSSNPKESCNWEMVNTWKWDESPAVPVTFCRPNLLFHIFAFFQNFVVFFRARFRFASCTRSRWSGGPIAGKRNRANWPVHTFSQTKSRSTPNSFFRERVQMRSTDNTGIFWW